MNRIKSNGELAANDSRANLIRAFKAHGCSECGVRYPAVDWSDLELAHLDASTKFHTANRLGRASVELILAELLKCRCLCDDCHRQEHSNGASIVMENQMQLFVGSGEAWRVK